MDEINDGSTRKIQEAARRILSDYDAGRANDVFAQRGSEWLTLAEAYSVQKAVANLRTLRGERSLGYKVGCISPKIQQQFGLQEPVFGRLWKSEMLTSGSTLTLNSRNSQGRRFVNFAIEGEIAVRLGADTRPGLDDEALAATIDGWFPVIELHNFVFRASSPSTQELVAGNAMHAGFVADISSVGAATDLGRDAEIEIKIDGNQVEAKKLSETPGGPLGSLRWLVLSLAQRAEGLKNGDIVLTGSPGKLIPVSGHKEITVTCKSQLVKLTVE